MSTSKSNTKRTLRVQSRTELLSDIRTFVSLAAKTFGFDETEAEKIELATDEACTNIIKHAYKSDPDGVIEIHIRSRKKSGETPQFVIEITDLGIPFDAKGYSAPDMKEYFSTLRHGGLGIVLMKKLMDEVEYMHAPNQPNTIRLMKRLQKTK